MLLDSNQIFISNFKINFSKLFGEILIWKYNNNNNRTKSSPIQQPPVSRIPVRASNKQDHTDSAPTASSTNGKSNNQLELAGSK